MIQRYIYYECVRIINNENHAIFKETEFIPSVHTHVVMGNNISKWIILSLLSNRRQMFCMFVVCPCYCLLYFIFTLSLRKVVFECGIRNKKSGQYWIYKPSISDLRGQIVIKVFSPPLTFCRFTVPSLLY